MSDVPSPIDANMNRNTNGQTFWATSMNGTVHEKISNVTAATTLRLPRSAHTATGRPHAIWATPPTKATAPSPVSLSRNDRWMSGASVPMAFENVPGMRAAMVSRTSGATPNFWRTPHNRGGLPVPVPGTRSRSATASRSRLLLTASTSSSSGTVKSKSGACPPGSPTRPLSGCSPATLVPDVRVRSGGPQPNWLGRGRRARPDPPLRPARRTGRPGRDRARPRRRPGRAGRPTSPRRLPGR